MAVPSDVAGTKAELKRAAKAAAAVVDERPSVERLYSLWHEMKAEGWQDMTYAPRDGTKIEMIEMGSIGIFEAAWISFGKEGPCSECGSFFGRDTDKQTYPMRGVMWRKIKPKKLQQAEA